MHPITNNVISIRHARNNQNIMKKIDIVIPKSEKVKRGGETATIGLSDFLSDYFNVRVITAGDFDFIGNRKIIPVNLKSPFYGKLFKASPKVMQRFIRRVHLDPEELKRIPFLLVAMSEILQRSPDVLYLRSAGLWATFLGLFIRKIRNIPFISIVGGWNMSEYEVAKFNPNLHISVNPDVADYLQKRLPRVNIKFLPNAFDSLLFYPKSSVVELNLQKPIFLTCGAVEPVKRYHLAIRAIAKLGYGSLIILGKGSIESEVRKEGIELLGNRRFFMRAVPYEEMIEYYNFCDVFTLPSSAESFGVAYLEAMGCNKPVVGTNDRGRAKIIGDAGILCNPENIEEYSIALKEALKTDWKDRPRKQAEKYDWKNIGPLYVDAINKVLERER